jgi:hypothetical protein
MGTLLISSFEIHRVNSATARPDAAGVFTFQNVYPGAYQITPRSAPAPYYPDSITLGGRDALDSDVDDSGAPPIDISYKLHGGSVHGTLKTVHRAGSGSCRRTRRIGLTASTVSPVAMPMHATRSTMSAPASTTLSQFLQRLRARWRALQLLSYSSRDRSGRDQSGRPHQRARQRIQDARRSARDASVEGIRPPAGCCVGRER